MSKKLSHDDKDSPEKRAMFKKLRTVSVRKLIPNLITIASICAGLTGLRYAFESNFETAVFMVLLAALLDGLDGRIARLIKGTSQFGAELDSFADSGNFGLVPALMLYFYALKDLGTLGWIIVLTFVVAMVLRLVRFNISLDDENAPAWTKNYFYGVSAPFGALLVMLPIYLGNIGISFFSDIPYLLWAYMLLIALLVVSRIPTFSGKLIQIRMPRSIILPLVILLFAVAALLFNYIWLALIASCLIYLGLIPVSSYYYYLRLKQDNIPIIDDDDVIIIDSDDTE
ncbi:MAG: CDP-alcohol phosphatidyltransferase family protein [Rhizobiales bacterium]|nr:CDP-alcohol phosphatidyltransferase family protein [Hyphomicrobiales bacterium]NRB13049.1 CDP-alcohol phosphatidyltransferase family protein [Hyphomicrobiales bacterium]